MNGDRAPTPEAHLALVHWVLGRRFGLATNDPRYDDAFQEGSIGLMRACEKYDPTRGASFATYAVPHIHARVRKFLREDGTVHIPEYGHNHAGGRLAVNYVSLDADDGYRPPEPCRDADQGDRIEAVETRRHVARLLTRLDRRSRRIVAAYFCFGDTAPVSYKDIGREVGISHERVRQLLDMAYARMRGEACVSFKTRFQRRKVAERVHASLAG